MKKSAIENQFKEKISEREIIPSKASWDRLDAMLAVAEKPKRNFKWIYVAASLAGFLLMGTLYFNQNSKENFIPKNSIVVLDSKLNPETSVKPAVLNLVKKEEANKVIKQQFVIKPVKQEADSNYVLQNNGTQIVQKEEFQESQIPIINQKTEQKTALRKSSYVNVDELLASVDNTPQKNVSAVAKTNVKVNSNALLTQVDGELDLTFREKAIKTVNQNFKAVKVALSNRNSE